MGSIAPMPEAMGIHPWPEVMRMFAVATLALVN
jgi:hypothetical protein